MPTVTQLLAATLGLTAGTFLLRLSGPLLRTRITFPPQAERLLEVSAVVLLTALVAVTALTEGTGPAGVARPAGVLLGGVLAWRRAPFLVVVLGAAAATAALRLIGVK
ncbi:AzlD domain-containing protein [Streptomyces odontomachi]|uniref:AzlD domain-containing protein n=1 Tax=Streptomyces odontomachi TaxID=2944940 RepID=UPI00210A9348|nr:AzlD domain-containing protein [Streptomyces sp. ODS25]